MIDKWFHEKNTNVTEIKEDNVDGHIKGTNLTDVERRSYVDRYGRMDKRQMKTVLRSASCLKKSFSAKKIRSKTFLSYHRNDRNSDKEPLSLKDKYLASNVWIKIKIKMEHKI